MRIGRIAPISTGTRSRPAGRRRVGASTIPSSLGLMVLRMISLNSLAAFTQEVTRSAGIQPARGTTTISPFGGAAAPQAQAQPQRTLEAVPPAPTQPLPCGSLLDLRV